MGQKVNPHGLRVGVIKNWDSRWFAKDEVLGDMIVADHKLRTWLKAKLKNAGVPKIEIERNNRGEIKVIIHCAKPGMIIGNIKEGENKIKALNDEVDALVGSHVQIKIEEVKFPDYDAQLVAENVASQLENRIAFRRAMKQAIGRTMKLGARGIKIACSGRLNGAEIARTEHYHEGTIPLQTIRADINYGFAEADTTYGKIGIKVWIYQGEVLPTVKRDRPRRDRRDDRRGDRPARRERAPREARENKTEGGAN